MGAIGTYREDQLSRYPLEKASPFGQRERHEPTRRQFGLSEPDIADAVRPATSLPAFCQSRLAMKLLSQVSPDLRVLRLHRRRYGIWRASH